MGVLLERVQFKFASIVGELCSEPDTLSQFAVWLDLRLAEYKLKGSISLDCSGKEPEACWMRGLNKCKKCGRRKQTDGRASSRSPPVMESPVSQQLAYNSQGSDSYQRSESSERQDLVVIKEEQDLFPVEIHQNSNSRPFSRKRPSRDWSESLSASPSKREWRSSTDPANQSLMSVIGDVTSGQQDSIEIDESIRESGENSDRTSDNLTDQPAAVSDSFMSAEQFVHEVSSTDQQGTGAYWMGEQSTSAAAADDHPHKGASPWMELDLLHGLRRQMNTARKQRISQDRLASIPRQTVTSMVATVGTFERWLWNRRSSDRRTITEIPSVELDEFLADFFKTIVTPSGANYTPKSFVMLWTCIKRYLKETNYPENPHLVFPKARQAFQKRHREIMKSRSSGPKPSEMNSSEDMS